ncbi:TPA: hypothetical protein ACKP8B_002521 [Serratia marcescens]
MKRSTPFCYCALLGYFYSGFSFAEFEAKVVWDEAPPGYFSGSIESKGKLRNPFPNDNLRCIDDWDCVAVWDMIIDGWGRECPKIVKSKKGTTLAAHIAEIERTMTGTCPVFTKIPLHGNEQICIRLFTRGLFSNGALGWAPNFVSSGGACGSDSNGVTIPPVTPPILPASCAIDDTITLSHGNVDHAAVNGSKANYNARLSCSRPVSVAVTVSYGGSISLNDIGTLNSTIYVDGKKGGNTYSNIKDKNIVFESVLSLTGGGIVSGRFEKSTVVTVNII